MAELEATTVRKGNKKVSVTLSGWVVKSMNWWDDGDIDSASSSATRTMTLATRFAITGSADDRARLVGRFQHHCHRARHDLLAFDAIRSTSSLA